MLSLIKRFLAHDFTAQELGWTFVFIVAFWLCWRAIWLAIACCRSFWAGLKGNPDQKAVEPRALE